MSNFLKETPVSQRVVEAIDNGYAFANANKGMMDPLMQVASSVGDAAAGDQLTSVAGAAPGADPVEASISADDVAGNITGRYSSPIDPEKIFAYQNDVEFPSAGASINVGFNQTKTTGSHPIFVAGGTLFPVGVVKERRRAIAAAAERNRKEMSEIMTLITSKAAGQYGDDVSDMVFDHFEKALADPEINYNWDKLRTYQSPKSIDFFKELNKIEAFSSETARLSALATSTLEKRLDPNGQTYISRNDKKAMMDFLSGSMDVRTMYEDKESFNNVRKRMDSYENLMTDLKTLAPATENYLVDIVNGMLTDNDVSKDVKDTVVKLIDNGTQESWARIMRDYIPKERLNDMAEAIYGMGDYAQSPEEIAEYLHAYYGNGKITVTDITIGDFSLRAKQILQDDQQAHENNLLDKNLKADAAGDGGEKPPSVQENIFTQHLNAVRSADGKGTSQSFQGKMTDVLSLRVNGADKASFDAGAKKIFSDMFPSGKLEDGGDLRYDMFLPDQMIGKIWTLPTRTGNTYQKNENGQWQNTQSMSPEDISDDFDGVPVRMTTEIKDSDGNMITLDRLRTDPSPVGLVSGAKPTVSVLYSTYKTDKDGNAKIDKDAPERMVIYDLTNPAQKQALESMISTMNAAEKQDQQFSRSGVAPKAENQYGGAQIDLTE